MVDAEYCRAWIDRYLRNELSAEDETRFENALLTSAKLQDELESTLAIRRVLQLETDAPEPQRQARAAASRLPFPWVTVALAARLVLAVLSGLMYWYVSHEMANLRSGLETLVRPHAHQIVVPLDIMRSAGEDLPEAIIHKPAASASVVLDIELSAVAVAAGSLQLMLKDTAGAELATWHETVQDDGRVRSVFDAEFLPRGLVWLEISDRHGSLLDRRLLEFR